MPISINRPIHPLATQAAAAGQVRKARLQANDWIKRYGVLHPFSQQGLHKSLSSVYPVGTPLHIQVSELERCLQEPVPQKELVAENLARAILKMPPSAHLVSPSNRNDHNYRDILKPFWRYSSDQLIELRSLLQRRDKGEAAETLLTITMQGSPWISLEELQLFLGEVLQDSEVARWFRNSDPWIALDQITAKDLLEKASEEKAEALQAKLGLLKVRVARREDVDPRFSAVYKCSKESRYELRPAALAQLLQLDKAIVPTTLVHPPGLQLVEEYMIVPKLQVGLLQPYMKNGIKIWTLTSDPEHAGWEARVPLDEYQEASLFIGLTKQADIHGNNGYFHEDSSGKLHLSLFDIGRSCYDDTPFFARKNGTKLLLRSALAGMPQFEEPLTEAVAQKIQEWKIPEIRAHLTVDNDWIRTVENREDELLYLVATEMWKSPESERKRHQLDHVMRYTGTAQQIDAFCRRIERLQSLVGERKQKGLPLPTMREAYEAMLPVEMTFFSLFMRVLGPHNGAVRAGKMTIEDLIQKGKEQGILNEEEVEEWTARLQKLLDQPEHKPLRHLVYPIK